jgi:hypothetical protein
MKSKTVADILQSRRDLLKLGDLGLLAASADAVWRLNVGATGSKAQPRASARNVLFYEVSGALSHVESFDFKENPGTPKDLDVRAITPDLSLSHPAHVENCPHYRGISNKLNCGTGRCSENSYPNPSPCHPR